MNFTLTPLFNTSNVYEKQWEKLFISSPDFACYLTYEEYLGYLKNIGWLDLQTHIDIVSLLYGPVLWTFAILGFFMNIVVAFSGLNSGCNSSSILIALVSLLLMVKSLNMLLMHDIIQG